MTRTILYGKAFAPRPILAALAILCLAASARGQATTPAANQSKAATSAAPATAPAAFAAAQSGSQPGEIVDRVVAIVNGDLILESDIDEERRLGAFQTIRVGAADNTRAKIIQRLTDRALILQQAKLQPEDAISDADVDKELGQLHKEIPACQRLHCDTDAGWSAFLAQNGFTEEELHARWKQRMEVLRFIEERFRSGIRIAAPEIKTYYNDTLVPEYARLKATPPKLEVVSSQISEVLLQQQVTALLEDWLRSLQAQGSVRLLTPQEEVAP